LEPEFVNVTVGAQTWRYSDSGHGPVVVLYHGFPDLPHSFGSIASALNDAGYRTIVPYLRGYHPETIVPGRGYDLASIAEDAVGLMDALKLDRAVLVGHDWGAAVAWGAASLFPDRVQAIVPIALPHPATLKPRNVLQAVALSLVARHLLLFRMPWAEAMTRHNGYSYIETIYERWAPDWRGPERDASIARIKAALLDRDVLRATIDYYRALSKRIDDRLATAIRCPGLIVAGGNDFGGHLGPYRRSQRLFESTSDLLVADGAGHWPHREHESLFLGRLIPFLYPFQKVDPESC
jgi:pimeloyl-ACP methyl ester carboxylesterase